MLLLTAAALDYTRAVNRRASLQQAADATILAVAQDLKQIYATSAIATRAGSYFAAAVDDSLAWIDAGPTVSSDNTQVCLTARTRVPTALMPVATSAGLAATTSVTVSATSCAKINNITYEIALALDNSGSMNEATSGTTKMASLQSAATQLLAIMDPPGATPKAAFSLVPFSSAVNVGAGFASASWMDTAGASSIHWQNFQYPQPAKYGTYAPTSKFEFFSNLGTAWGGCVEERPAPYMTTDTPASSGTPDTLYVPYLWPDEGTSVLQLLKGLQPMNNYLSSSNLTCTLNPVYGLADAPYNLISVSNSIQNTLRSDTQSMICKYKGQSLVAALSSFLGLNGNALKAGPNLLCSSQGLTTLTTNTTTLASALSTMLPGGDTNLIGGLMWAWRTISPNGPFGTQAAAATGNQNPVAYATKSNIKVIILMTDGYNHWANSTAWTNGSAYSSLGYFANGRLGTTTTGANYRTLMDNATLGACANAKAAGVQIFTVGFTIPSDPIDAAGLSLLQSCATTVDMAYVAQDGSALIGAFKSIAASISGLRLVN